MFTATSNDRKGARISQSLQRIDGLLEVMEMHLRKSAYQKFVAAFNKCYEEYMEGKVSEDDPEMVRLFSQYKGSLMTPKQWFEWYESHITILPLRLEGKSPVV
jgi:hypothetical protein